MRRRQWEGWNDSLSKEAFCCSILFVAEDLHHFRQGLRRRYGNREEAVKEHLTHVGAIVDVSDELIGVREAGHMVSALR